MENNSRAREYLAISTNNIIGDSWLPEITNINSPENYLRLHFNDFSFDTPNEKPVSKEVNNKKEEYPLIYIYNTHQNEEYYAGNLIEHNLTPTVLMASFMLKTALEKYNIYSVVEEDNLKDALKGRGLVFSQSYQVSRMWLEAIKVKHPTIKYFIDLHRDSVSESATINGVTYARLMFVVGMNHQNYQENEKLMIELHNYLENKYDGLMRRIYYGRNSRYNQDFNSNTILVEVGGPKNTILEVYNTINLLAEAIASLIGEL